MKKININVCSVIFIVISMVLITACGASASNSEFSVELNDYLKSKINVSDEKTSISKEKTNVETDENDTVEFVLEEAKKMVEENDYVSALIIIKKAIEEFEECPELKETYGLYTKLFKEQLFAEVDELLSNAKYLDALGKFQEVEDIIIEDEELIYKKSECENAYVEDVINQVHALDVDDINNAENIINEALKVLPNNEKLLELKENINEQTPKKLLLVCPPYETNYYSCEGSYMMGGESYHNGFDLNTGYQDSYAIFNLGGKYQTLEFDLGHVDDTAMHFGKFDIYLDEEVVDTILVNAEDLPEHYVIELNGAQQLKIVSEEIAFWYPHYAFVNCILNPTGLQKNTMENEIDKNKLITKKCPPYETEGYTCEDTYEVAGEIYYNGFDLNIYSDAYAIFNLGGEYNTFEFDLGHVDGTSMHSGKFDFYLDGEVVYTITLNADSLPKHFVIDLKGSHQLKIVSVESSFYSSQYAFLNAIIY